MNLLKSYIPIVLCTLLLQPSYLKSTATPAKNKTVTLTQEPIQQERIVKKFSKISITGAIDLHLTYAPRHSVTLTGPLTVLDAFETTVKNETLIMKFTAHPLSTQTQSPLRVAITTPHLSEIELSGAISGKIVHVSEESLHLIIHGASDLQLQGVCKHFKLEAVGSSSINARTLTTETTTITAHGSNTLLVNAAKTLSVQATGASTIKHVGKPIKIDKSLQGAATVEQLVS